MLIACILKFMFPSVGVDPAGGGIWLDLRNGRKFRLFIKFGYFTADEEMLAVVVGTRGANATKLCYWCLNCMKHGSIDLEHDASGYYVSHTVMDTTKLRFSTDASVRAVYRRLDNLKPLQKTGEFVRSQQLLGYTHNPGNILLQPALDNLFKPVEHVLFDYMHCNF